MLPPDRKKLTGLAALALAIIGLLMGVMPALADGTRFRPYGAIQPTPVTRVRLDDAFLRPWRERLLAVTLPSQWEMMETHHHLDNFRVAAGQKDGVHQGPFFLDSDLYKWLEAAEQALRIAPNDAGLAARVDEISGLIEAAQMDDGYLNTYYQSFAPEKRWEILFITHEAYCAGHFLEAAAAAHEARGDARLLAVARRLGDHLVAEFGPGGNPGVDGHEEVELALVRLYRATGEPRYLDLAADFVHRRGRDPHFKRELIQDLLDQAALSARVRMMRRPWRDRTAAAPAPGFALPRFDPKLGRYFADLYTGRNFQVDRPVVETVAPVGHAVRAMYLYSGAADVCLETGDQDLGQALDQIWESMAERRSYLTGGLGSFPVIEGFGKDYELPNDSYTETCAAISGFFFSHRMLLLDGDPRRADQMERAFYNAILSGISLDGRHYFYQNPLSSQDGRQRQEWYTVACCPPNIARTLASIEGYIFGESAEGVYVNLFLGAEAEFDRPEGRLKLKLESGLPWSGKVRLELEPERPTRTTIFVRHPGWAPTARAWINGEAWPVASTPGSWLALEREWRPGDVVELEFELGPRLVEAAPQVKADRGKAALMLGPLVYCLEDLDQNGADPRRLTLAADPRLALEAGPPELEGARVIVGDLAGGGRFVAVPFYAWANRGPSRMEVWIKKE